MRVRVVVVLPYPNPHFLGLIDALLSDTRLEARILYFSSQEKFRKNFKLSDFGSLRAVKFFSRDGIRELINAQVAIVHGLFYWHTLFASFLLVRKRVVFTSEPFSPFNKSILGAIVKSIIVFSYKMLFKEIIILSCGGAVLKEQLIKVGLKCRYYKFGLFPRVKLNEELLPLAAHSTVNFAFVGQFIPRKNLQVLFNAIESVNESVDYFRRYKFSFVGDGIQKDEVLSFTRQYENVEYLGVKSAMEVRDFFDKNHVLILPSFFDGWGAVVNEAVFSGNAILVAPRVYSSTMYLQAGVNGFYIDEYDASDLVKRMKGYIDNPLSLQAHRRASLAIAKSNSPSVFVDDLYLLLCGKFDTNTLELL